MKPRPENDSWCYAASSRVGPKEGEAPGAAAPQERQEYHEGGKIIMELLNTSCRA